jgi:glutathione S-transferase
MPRLITIPISHYCERARWALDRAGIAFTEERHVQGVHRVAARRAGGGSTVPVLVSAEGVFSSSDEILGWVDARTPQPWRLFAAGEDGEQERALCKRAGEVLGPAARRLTYRHMTAHRALALRFNNQGVRWWERAAIGALWPLITRYVRRELGIADGGERADEAIVWAEFDRAAELLQRRGPFLSGERFGAADLTFACMAAAVVFPPVYGVCLPQPHELPPRTAALVQRARSHPAGAHALRMFLEHRHERLGEASPGVGVAVGAPDVPAP